MSGRPARRRSRRSAGRIWLALSIVYVVRSTPYLAIDVVNDTVPPLVGAGVRS